MNEWCSNGFKYDDDIKLGGCCVSSASIKNNVDPAPRDLTERTTNNGLNPARSYRILATLSDRGYTYSDLYRDKYGDRNSLQSYKNRETGRRYCCSSQRWVDSQ